MDNIECRFSKWIRWEKRDALIHLNCPGVYAINRSEHDLTNVDFTLREEIIYFGVADHLERRLKQFDNTISQKRNSHGGADRTLNKYRDYAELVSRLYVAILNVGITPIQSSSDCWRTKGDARQLEYHCIAEYLEKYGRLPIFNDQKSVKFSQSATRS